MQFSLKMSEKSDTMQMCGGEDAETCYFQEVTKYEHSLDHSIDSLQGSMALPTFTMGQSGDLHNSQGFQISNLSFSQRSDELGSHKMTSSQRGTLETVGSVSNHGHVTPSAGQLVPDLRVQGSTLIFQGSQFGALNTIQSSDHFQKVLPCDLKESNSGTHVSRVVFKNETTEASIANDVFEGGSSDEKSGRCKTSPKRRGRKSRSTSSTGNEMSVKSEASGPSPSRMDTSDQQQSSGDMGFKPSLLDEILTEKKMALMRSPAVIQFLQSQQQQQAREKALPNRQSTSSR